MTNALELDALWGEFHRAVNTPARTPATWPRIREADEGSEALPERAGSATEEHRRHRWLTPRHDLLRASR